MVDESTVEVVRHYLRVVRRSGIQLKRGVVFGSHARGEATPDSDIDLIVIAPEFDGARDRKRTAVLWRLRAETDSRIEPIAIGERQWLEEDGDPLLCIARSEGQEITLT